MPTPAPDLVTIFSIEEAIEPAVKAVLLADGITAFTQQEVENLTGTRVDIQFALGAEQGHKGKVDAQRWTADAWFGTLILQIITPRLPLGDPHYSATAHATMRAKCRIAFQYFENRFDETVLPYHTLSQIKAAGTEPAVVVEQDSDVSVLRYDCVVAVRAGAWPV